MATSHKSHLEQIDALISQHRAEIERLEIARDVIFKLNNKRPQQRPRGITKVSANAERQMEFVVRRKTNRHPRGRVKDADIRAALAHFGQPVKVSEIASYLGFSDKRAKDVTRAALGRMQKKGETIVEDHHHSLAATDR